MEGSIIGLNVQGGPISVHPLIVPFTMESRRWFTASACARFIIRESNYQGSCKLASFSVKVKTLRNWAYAFTSAVLDMMKVTGLLSSKQICRSVGANMDRINTIFLSLSFAQIWTVLSIRVPSSDPLRRVYALSADLATMGQTGLNSTAKVLVNKICTLFRSTSLRQFM